MNKRWLLEGVIIGSIMVLSFWIAIWSGINTDEYFTWMFIGVGTIYASIVIFVVEAFLLYKQGKKNHTFYVNDKALKEQRAIDFKEALRVSKITCEVLRIDTLDELGVFEIIVIQNQKRKSILIGKNDKLYDIIKRKELKAGDVFIND